jgi:C1A family cysteine protease
MNYTGWLKQAPDKRDLKFKPTVRLLAVPLTKDLRPKMSPIDDQLDLGSRTANAGVATYEYLEVKHKAPVINHYSRRMLYWLARRELGTINEDSGANLRDIAYCLDHYGDCLEVTDPYVVSRFTRTPTKAAFAEALTYQAIEYRAVASTEAAMKACLAEGYPFIFGFDVYKSFISDKVAVTGMVPMPNESREDIVGGHAMVCVGYTKANWILRNSWGEGWGKKGYCFVPKAFMPKYAQDNWMFKQVERI